MPRSTAMACRAASSSIWVSLAAAAARLTFESLGFTGPAVLLRLGDPVAQVVANAGETCPLGWVGPQERTPDAAVLVDDRVGDEQPAEIVGREPERPPGGVGEAGGCQGDVEQLPDGLGGDGPVLCAQAALEQQRHRRVPLALVVVIGDDQGNGVLF